MGFDLRRLLPTNFKTPAEECVYYIRQRDKYREEEDKAHAKFEASMEKKKRQIEQSMHKVKDKMETYAKFIAVTEHEELETQHRMKAKMLNLTVEDNGVDAV